MIQLSYQMFLLLLFVEESEIERLGQELTEFYHRKVNYEKSGKKIVEILSDSQTLSQ